MQTNNLCCSFVIASDINFETEQRSTVQEGCIQSSWASRQYEKVDSFSAKWASR